MSNGQCDAAAITAAQQAWIKDNCPILLQPDIDQHQFVHICWRFDMERAVCYMSLIYTGESSYNRYAPHIVNRVGTFFYRSYNHAMYHRTADINYIEYHGVDLKPYMNASPESIRSADIPPPWTSIRTSDHCGQQCWHQGHRGNQFTWSFMLHYAQRWHWSQFKFMHRDNRHVTPTPAYKCTNLTCTCHVSSTALSSDSPYVDVQIQSRDWAHVSYNRPILFVNTCNHLMAPLPVRSNLAFLSLPALFAPSTVPLSSSLTSPFSYRIVHEYTTSPHEAEQWVEENLQPDRTILTMLMLDRALNAIRRCRRARAKRVKENERRLLNEMSS